MAYLDTNGLNTLWNRIKTVFATKSEIPTESTVSGWGFTKNTGSYSKPSGGIPKTDLASTVQTSLGKADTALQSYTETDPTVPSHVKAITAAQITAWDSKGDSNLALGETSTTAYRGDRGKTAYDHSQSTHAPTESKTAASGGTTLSLVTTGEKYTWNNKSSLALGTTSSTAYRGDRGLTAYNHSQSTHAPTDAQKNVQSDWNQTTTTADDYIKNKPSIPTKTTVSGWGFLNSSDWQLSLSDNVVMEMWSGPEDSDHLLVNYPIETNVRSFGDSDLVSRLYVDTAISTALTGAAKYCGTLASESALAGLKNFKQGNYWIVSTAWTSSTLGKTLDVGNFIFANADGSTYAAAKFDVIQADIDAIPTATINALS